MAKGSIVVDISVSEIIKCVPWQKCPVCDGEGIVLDRYAMGTSSSPTKQCPSCMGFRMVAMFVIKE